jgi:hypothetical protein
MEERREGNVRDRDEAVLAYAKRIDGLCARPGE